jgi:hypothetical protein
MLQVETLHTRQRNKGNFPFSPLYTYELRSRMVIRMEPLFGQFENTTAFPRRGAARHPMTVKSQPARNEVASKNMSFGCTKDGSYTYKIEYVFWAGSDVTNMGEE